MVSTCFNEMWMFPIFPIIMMLICLVAVYLIFGRGRFSPPCCGADPYSPRSKDSESALEILKKRYAAGEISKEEFDKIKKGLL